MQLMTSNTLFDIAINMAQGLSNSDRFARLLDAIRKSIQCDAVALLALRGNQLEPLAIQGLSAETLGRRFVINEHPRLRTLCQSRAPVIFPEACDLPDPYDGLLLDREGNLPVHACMGMPLYFSGELLGVLTLDSMQATAFDALAVKQLEMLSAIAASTLKLALTIQQLEHQAQHSQQLVTELSEEAWLRDGGEIVGNSQSMAKLKTDVAVVAPSHFNILIYGETGVGKELVARSLHHQSQRSQQPLVYVNCAALPEQLIESELFGHVKGAFTGADAARAGKFSLANGGSLFLDEIGELPLAAQSKLLRVLQNNEIQPVGQDKIEYVDVRVLAATNRDLKQEVEQGNFRADLYHRLSVYPINVPPLRDRSGDVEVLAGFFLERAKRQLGAQQLRLATPACQQLNHYHWPGNVRELEHVINRGALKALARQGHDDIVTISAADCGPLNAVSASPIEDAPGSAVKASATSASVGLKVATETFQRTLIADTLRQHDYNWSAAARALSTDRANLTRLAKRLGLNITKLLS
ncbi:nitric oxide reductase transcriptional regulator NorR [Motilimonas pumila]|uniref:Nitric oxide reductase transcriptional regulator NorR n=1 Tax=Motilimonas pumila TaxID=2303987 RepID=A0A418YC73_9GAMM|nr:nitric oxide reductase transcriptional regulator NorR [Motilimonas pumila]RJG42111.1 nitric oxide reductase transcriptional regulator NorR [Motilimonas pumila]